MAFSPETYALLKGQGGGGGGLPPVTFADVGKGLSVQYPYVAGTVIVPETTVTFSGNDVKVTNTETELTAGQKYIFTVNGTSEIILCNDNYGSLVNSVGDVIYVDEFLWFKGHANGTYTISLAEAEQVESPSWVADPYAGYDIVIVRQSEPNEWIGDESFSLSRLKVIKGSLPEIEQKVVNGGIVSGLLIMHDSYNGNGYDTSYRYELAYFSVAYTCLNFVVGKTSNYNYVEIRYDSNYDFTHFVWFT